MAFSVTIKLTTAGADTGPTFNLYSNVDSYTTAFETGVSKTNLTSTNGYTSTLVPDNTTTIKVKSVNGSCPTAEVSLLISGIVTPTATPTATPTSTAGVTSTPTSTSTPTINATPTTTPTTTPTSTSTTTSTSTEAADCYYVLTGNGVPLSGGAGNTTGLIKVTTSIINVWAKYNSAGTSSGTASFGLTIGGLSATGGFTITGPGQVGYTNSGGSNNLTYFVLTPGTYEFTLVKSDTYSAGNNVNIVYSTGTDPASATNLQQCLTEPLGPYLSLVNATATPTTTSGGGGGGVVSDGTYDCLSGQCVEAVVGDYADLAACQASGCESSGGGGCFIEGTMVTLSDGTQKPIEQLVIGDILKSYNIDTLPLYSDDETVLNTWSSNNILGNSDVATVTSIVPDTAYGIIILNNSLKTTSRHRHLIKRDGVWSFIQAYQVVVGDIMLDINNNEVEVTSRTTDKSDYTIYKLDVENLDVFYANNILTHNVKQTD